MVEDGEDGGEVVPVFSGFAVEWDAELFALLEGLLPLCAGLQCPAGKGRGGDCSEPAGSVLQP